MSSNSHHDNDRYNLSDSTRICYGVDVIINAILQILNHTKKVLICLDQSRPSLMVDIDVLKNAIVAAKRRELNYVVLQKLLKITFHTANN
ncbi:MAG: hypothetical protein WCA39_06250 [Nitrososphaeraceae archaeon]